MEVTSVWPLVRPSLPLALPTVAFGITFGLIGVPLLGAWACVAMSALVWSGTAQLAALSALGSGAGLAISAGTGLLANIRYLPMGLAIAPNTRGSALRRAGIAATLADASFAIAHRREGGFHIAALVAAAPVQYLSWVAGTAIGATSAGLITDPHQLGLDVILPVVYLALVLPDLRANGRARIVAATSVAITLAATPFLPAGVPVVLATAAALIAARR